MAKRIRTRLSRTEGRRFGLTLGLAFGGLGALLLWRSHVHAATVAGVLSALLLVAGIAIPTRLGPVQAGWMRFALLISKVTTPVFMGVIYFVVLMPIGLLLRLFGRNAIKHKAGEAGYWVKRETHRSDLSRQF